MTSLPLIDIPVGISADASGNAYIAHKELYQQFAPYGSERRFCFSYEPTLGGVARVRSRHFPAPLQALGVIMETPPPGAVRRFRLVASPMISSDVAKKRVRFRRGDIASRLAWLDRQAAQAGFKVIGEPTLEVGEAVFHRKGKTFTMERTVFTGELEVIDSPALDRALENGIGRSRAYGFGLLTLY